MAYSDFLYNLWPTVTDYFPSPFLSMEFLNGRLGSDHIGKLINGLKKKKKKKSLSSWKVIFFSAKTIFSCTGYSGWYRMKSIQYVCINFPNLKNEPSHEKTDLSVVQFEILQTHMRSLWKRSEVWLFAWSFHYIPILCERTAKALARLRGCTGLPEPSLVAYVIYLFHMGQLNHYFTEYTSIELEKAVSRQRSKWFMDNWLSMNP